MSDVNDKLKKDDWGTTIPRLRPGKEKGAGNFSNDFAPPKLAKQSRIDDWEMISPNLDKPNSQPFSSDFDKITLNINIPKDVRQDQTPQHQISRQSRIGK